MATLSLAERQVWVDDAGIPLLSGEVHYWRLAPASWQDVLQRVKDLGLQMVATYVCWDFHEPTRGYFDFRGETDPRRNLVGFLDLLSEEGFWIIVRPGPYIYSEWRNAGAPEYAARYHRLHPAFLEAARDYMEAVVAEVKPYFATQGGRIILLQADNEIDPWSHWHTEQLGLGRQAGLFHEFLRQRYGDLQALNEAWGTSYKTFEEARAICAMPLDEPNYMRRFLDFCRFRHWYVRRAACWMVDTYRELGVDIPIYLNTYSSVEVQPWADLESLADLAGPDLYPTNEFAHRPDEHRHFLEAVRYTRTYSRLPYIPEFEAGIWHGWHYDVGTLTPNHYRLACLSALLAGIAGWNWYMLVNRDNWYMSPINEWGRVRPELFEAFRQIVALYHEMDPPTLTKLTDTAVTFDPLQQAAQRPGQELLHALYQADIDYEFYDVNQGKCVKPLLLHAGGSWLSAPAQERLLEYVSSGGHLVCLGAYPRFDDQLHPLNLLEVVDPPGILSGVPEGLRLALELEGAKAIVESPWLFSYQEVPGDPIVAERLPSATLTAEENEQLSALPAGTRYAIGYTEQRGQGRLTVVGLTPSPDLLLALHRHFGVPIYARSRTSDISTALFQRDEAFYLVAVNHG
ncbi:MAG TPA: hypothetical protein EYH31_12095, partial [Anaerolineae bacterium]|nr:hypothetical protein [Anaerolineae bacterium]